jgi:predicted Co/Zn/Cd cation transporter (cation efflux family)
MSLALSTAAALGVGVMRITFALMTNSQSILLDGLFNVRMTRPRRIPYILVHVLLPEDGEHLAINVMDSYRVRVLQAVACIHQRVIIDVVFTTIEKFAAPTAGFVLADMESFANTEGSATASRRRYS